MSTGVEVSNARALKVPAGAHFFLRATGPAPTGKACPGGSINIIVQFYCMKNRLEVYVTTLTCCEENYETKFKALEEKATDEMEVAAQKDEKRKKKKDFKV
jgi:hypothetical protein